MQHLKVSGAVRPLKWSLGVKWLIDKTSGRIYIFNKTGNVTTALIHSDRRKEGHTVGSGADEYGVSHYMLSAIMRKRL